MAVILENCERGAQFNLLLRMALPLGERKSDIVVEVLRLTRFESLAG